MSFKTFKSFSQKAATRSGVAFEIKTVQKNFDGVITAVKGHVFLKDETNKTVQQEMLWNLKGQAMLVGEQFDLVKEVLIEDLEDNESTELEIAE